MITNASQDRKRLVKDLEPFPHFVTTSKERRERNAASLPRIIQDHWVATNLVIVCNAILSLCDDNNPFTGSIGLTANGLGRFECNRYPRTRYIDDRGN